MQSSPGTLISFATQPRSVALDDDDGHSPYTRALAETMQRPGFGLFQTFNEVGLAVEKATHGDQLPWLSSSPISGSFYFAGKPVAATQANLPAPAAAIGQTPLAPRDDAALRRDLITDCDRLAAMPYDSGHAPALQGLDLDKIDIAAAGPACDDAMKALSRRDGLRVRGRARRRRAQGFRRGTASLRQGRPRQATRWHSTILAPSMKAATGHASTTRKRRTGTRRRSTSASRSRWSIAAISMRMGTG
jgi:hypothetical protein